VLPHQLLDVLHLEDPGHIAARNDRDSDNDGPVPCSTLAIINPLARDYANVAPTSLRASLAATWMRRSQGTGYVKPRTLGRERRRGSMLAAIGGIGVVGILVIVLIMMAIIYFVRRS
jgi:hypothetical protein